MHSESKQITKIKTQIVKHVCSFIYFLEALEVLKQILKVKINFDVISLWKTFQNLNPGPYISGCSTCGDSCTHTAMSNEATGAWRRNSNLTPDCTMEWYQSSVYLQFNACLLLCQKHSQHINHRGWSVFSFPSLWLIPIFTSFKG